MGPPMHLGPPPRRPLARRLVATSTPTLRGPPAVTVLQPLGSLPSCAAGTGVPPPRIVVAKAGTPMPVLRLGLAQYGGGGETTGRCSPTGLGLGAPLRSPLGSAPLRSPLGAAPLRSPASGRGVQGVERLCRRSLTRIADRVTSQITGLSDDSRRHSSEPYAEDQSSEGDSSRRSSTEPGTSEEEDPVRSTGSDLGSQLWQEMRRRKSQRDRPPPLTGFSSSSTYPAWTVGGAHGATCESPRPAAYTLTPVKEQGETPYRD